MIYIISVILESLAFTYISYLLGRLFLEKISKENPDPIERLLFSITIGYGLMACLGLVLALCKIFSGPYIYSLFILITLLSWRTFLFHLGHLFSRDFWSDRSQDLRFWFRKNTLLKIILIVWIAVYFIISLSPTAMGKDGLAYHLPFSSDIVHKGAIVFPVWGNMNYGHLPVLAEVFYAVQIDAFNNLGVTKVIEFFGLMILALGIVYFIQKRFNNKLISYLLLILLLSCMPLIKNALAGGMIDIWSYLFGLFSIIKLCDYLLEEKIRTDGIVIAGILLGLSLGVKYLSLFFLVIAGVIIIITSMRRRWSFGKLLKVCLIFLLPAFIFCGFWYMKNLAYTGNPFYPIFTMGRGEEFTTEVNDFILDRTFANLILFPFLFFGKDTFHLPFGIFTALSFLVSYLGLIYLAIKRKLDGFIVYLVIGMEIFLFLLFFWSHQIRFAIPALVINCILIVFVLDRLPQFSEKMYRNSFTALALLLAITSIATYKAELKCALGIRSLVDCQEELQGGAVHIVDYINKNYKDQAVVQYWTPVYEYSMKNGNYYLELNCSKDKISVENCLAAKKIRYYIDETKARKSPGKPDNDFRLLVANYFLKNGKKLTDLYDPRRNTTVSLYELPQLK